MEETGPKLQSYKLGPVSEGSSSGSESVSDGKDDSNNDAGSFDHLQNTVTGEYIVRLLGFAHN